MVDMEPFDISHPIQRPATNDIFSPRMQLERHQLYLQLSDSLLLLPIPFPIIRGTDDYEVFYTSLLAPPELRNAQNEVIAIEEFLSSPLARVREELGFYIPKFSLHGNILQVSFPIKFLDLVLLYRDCSLSCIELSLVALTRTLLHLPEVSAVQYLIADQAMSIASGSFSLAEPIFRIPFLNLNIS
jgi:hypothetical protein